MPIALVSRDANNITPGARARQVWNAIPQNQRDTWCIYLVNEDLNGFELWANSTPADGANITNTHGVIFCHGGYTGQGENRRSTELSVRDHNADEAEFDTTLYIDAITTGVGINFLTLNVCVCYAGYFVVGEAQTPIQRIVNIRENLDAQGPTMELMGMALAGDLRWNPLQNGWIRFN